MEFPTKTNLGDLFELCAAVSSRILEFFDKDLLSRLTSPRKEFCSGSFVAMNDLEVMLAQDILAQSATAFRTPQTPSKCSLETPPGASSTNAGRKRVLKLFSETNASTTLKLTLLRLSIFCSEGPNSSVTALEGISVAQRIVAPIQFSIREQCAEMNLRLVEKFPARLYNNVLCLNVQVQLRTQHYTLCLGFIS